MNQFFQLSLAVLSVVAFSPAAPAQQIIIGDGSSALTLNSADFATNGDGVSTLNTPLNYISNLATDLSVPKQLDLTGAGWVFNSDEGTDVIADTTTTPAVSLADPSVSYGYFFINTTGNDNQPFSMQFTTSFPDTSFNPSFVKASFSTTLTDGSPALGQSSTATLSQTAVLGEMATAGGALIGSTGLTAADLGPVTETATNGGSTTAPTLKTPGFPSLVTGPPGGPFNALVVTVSGTYSTHAIVSVSGRVDAVPEPNAFALFVVGTFAGLVFHWRRNAHRQS